MNMASLGIEDGKSVMHRDNYNLSNKAASKCCSACKILFQEKISRLTRKSFEPLRPTGLYLGKLQHIDQYSYCPLCRFFHSMRFEVNDSNDYHLMAWLPLQLFTPGNSEYPKVLGLPGSFLFGVTAGEDRLMSGLQAIQQSKNAGLIAMESSELRSGTQAKWIDHLIFRDKAFRAHKVSSSELDYNLLRHWIESSSECETNWSSFLKDEEALSKDLQDVPIYVIDCLNWEIVAWTSKMEFVALSYVWGSPGTNMVERAHFFPCPLPQSRPLVIEDSIIVVRKLGLRYLWVDQYCICQWDPALKAAQISRMDSIYKWSKFTIIAAAGQDSEYGLPGVSKRRRLQQPSIDIDGHTLLATMPDPNMVCQNSKWSTRAWTYQERFFSNLCLVFTDHQVFYECQDHSGYQCESSSFAMIHRKSPTTLTGQRLFPLAEIVDPYNSMNERFVIHPPGSTIKPAVLLSLGDHIMQYTSRDLTFDSDSLNAISAILRQFQLQGVEFLHGLPLRLHHKRSGSEKLVYDRYNFAYSLCWTHVSTQGNPPRRREEFPSWSWAGWTGSVSWLPHESEEFHSSTSEVLELGYDVTPSVLSSIPEQRGDARLSDKMGNLLHVRATALHLQFETEQSSDDSTRSKQPSLFLRSSQLSGIIPLYITRHTAPGQDFQQRLSTDTWTGLVLGHGKRSEVRYVLVAGKINLGDPFLERVGVMKVPDQWYNKQERHNTHFLLG